MSLIGVDDWSSDKERSRPTRLEAKVESFTETGKSFVRKPYLKLKEGCLIVKLK